jgi:Tfp pilus assembly protein PilF
MAQANLQRGNIDIAKAMADDAYSMVEAAGNREQTALSQAILAQIYVARSDFSAAQVMYRDALGLLEKIGGRLELVRIKLNYAQFLAQQGKAKEAASLKQEVHLAASEMKLFLPRID